MTTRRPNGSGSVEVLPDGRARIRIMVDGKRRQLGPIQPDEATARRLLAAWLAERSDGVIVAPTEITLGSYGSDWLDVRELDGSHRRERVRSIASERSVWTRQVLTSEIAGMPIVAIEPRDVRAWTRELRGRKALQAITYGRGEDRRTELRETDRPLSRAQQREALRLVRSVLAQAAEDGIIERNPAEGIEVARGSARPRDLSEDWLRWPEAEQLLSCAALPARDRRAYACAIGLALRADDLRAIEVEHVELDCEVPGPGVRVWISKSQKWHRVPVMPWLAPIIREQLESLVPGARYLFGSNGGRTRYAKGYDYGWAEHREGGEVRDESALVRAGIKRRIRFHDLRGTAATHLALGTWGRRWSLHEIQAMLAHSDQRVTERYVRRAIDMLAEAASATPGPAPRCPALPMASSGENGESARFSGTPGAGIEPATNRLTAPASPESFRGVRPTHGQRMGSALAATEAAMAALAEGDPLAVRRLIDAAALSIEAMREALAEWESEASDA